MANGQSDAAIDQPLPTPAAEALVAGPEALLAGGLANAEAAAVPLELPVARPAEPPRIHTYTATMLVVATMIGTGVLTTTGLLIRDLGSPLAVLGVWGLGGVLALSGALSYAELSAAIPRNGGEYLLLSRIYHPAVGFVAGLVSLVVGFAAPVAATAIAFEAYLAPALPWLPPNVSAIALIAVLSAFHALSVRAGSRIQNTITTIKLGLVGVLIAGGLAAAGAEGLLAAAAPGPDLLGVLVSPACAVGLILVTYAYTGWNAAAYLAGEMHDAPRRLPLAIGLGTAIVTALYLALTLVFLAVVPAERLAGQIDVAHLAAEYMFGPRAAVLISLGIALLLASTLSAMTMAGPRIYQAMGEDYARLAFLRYRTRGGGPAAAVALQGAIAVAFVLTAGFGAILAYVGVTLAIMAGLVVAGVFVLRWREPGLPRPYRALGYPLTPALFVLLSGWMVIYSALEQPMALLTSLLTIAGALAAYLLLRR